MKHPNIRATAYAAVGAFCVAHMTWAQEEEVFELSPFSIDASEDQGYYASQSMAGGRLATDIINTGTSIEVVTKDFMDDIGANDIQELLQYTTGTEIGGVLGNFTGAQFNSAEGAVNTQQAQRNPDRNSRIRGLASPDDTRNFYVTNIPADQYNTERLDINRGSNSFLFGLGSPAGLINQNLSKAHFKDSSRVRFRLASGGERPTYRTEIDLNRVLVEDKLAVRIAGMLNRTQYRQRPTYRDDNRIYGTFTYNPFENKNTTIRGHWESGSIISNAASTVLPLHALDTWIDHRLPIDVEYNTWYYRHQYGPSAGDFNPNPDRYPESPDLVGSYWPTYELVNGKIPKDENGDWIGYQRPGIGGLIGNMGNNGLTQVYDGSNGRDVGFILQNQWQGGDNHFLRGSGSWVPVKEGKKTVGYSWKTTKPGDPFWSPDGRVNGNVSMVAYKNFREADERSVGWNKQGFTDLETFDFSKYSLAWNNDWWERKFYNYNFDLEQIFLDGKAGVNVGFNYEKSNRETWTALTNGNSEIAIDINKTMPLPQVDANGDILRDEDGNVVPGWQENPNFGRPYIVSRQGYGDNRDNSTTLRATAFYKLDFEEESWMKWLGSHTFTILGDQSTEEYRFFGSTLTSFGDWDVGRHLWNNTGAKATTGVRNVGKTIYIGPAVQSYLGDEVWDPSTPLSLSDIKFGVADYNLYTPEGWTTEAIYWNKGPDADVIAVEEIGTNSKLINGNEFWGQGVFAPQWVPNEGVQIRQTKIKSYAANAQSFFFNDHLVINSGYREDYIDSWLNKNAPKAGQDLIPQISPDVFRWDDPVWGELTEVEKGPNGSGTAGYGAVLHWPKNLVPLPEGTNVSFHYNYSKNFVPDTSRLGFFENDGQVALRRIASPGGQSKDYGVTFQLFDRKVIARLNWYENSLDGATSSVGGVFNQNLNKLFQYFGALNQDITELDSSDGTINGALDGVISNAESIDSFRDAQYDANGNEILDPSIPNQDPDNPIYLMETDQMVIDRVWPNWDAALAARDDAWGLLQKGYWQTKVARDRIALNQDGSITQQNINGLTDSEDIVATGFESSITLNPTRSWRMQINVARQETVASNIAPLLTRFIYDEWVPYLDKYGQLDWDNPIRPRQGQSLAANVDENLLKYHTIKSLEGFPSDEVREWRVNLITNYSFREGMLKGFNIGGSARWQSSNAIGYPLIEKVVNADTGSSIWIGDVTRPWMGEEQMNYDLQMGYTKKLSAFTEKLQDVNWNIQLNLRNLNNLDSDALSPVAAQPDGSYARVRWDPPFQAQLTNTFSW